MVRRVNNGEPHNVGKPEREQYPREMHNTKMETNDAGLGVINGPNSRAAMQTAKFANKATRAPTQKSAGKAVMVAGRKFREIALHAPKMR